MMNQTSFSIVIPVLQEDSIINETIGRIRGLDGSSGVEVIVVDCIDGSSTLHAIIDEKVIKVHSSRGRGRQMNEGALYATGDILLFLHADTELPLHTLTRISHAMQDKEFSGGAFNLTIRSRRPVFRIIEFAATLRSRITRIPFGDQAIFMRKDYFERLGGYQDIPIMEDVEIMKRIRKMGGRIIILRDKVATSPRRWENEGILRCTLRNWLLQLLYASGVSAYTLARLYK